MTDTETDRNLGDVILEAGRRLVVSNGTSFTTQDLIREAGVALQTFYRYYESKDQLMLAVMTEQIAAHCAALKTAVASIEDPVARLEFYFRQTLAALHPDFVAGAQFFTAEHWRLHQLFPNEVQKATQSFTDLLCNELIAGSTTGRLQPRNPQTDAWLMTKTLLGAYHHYAFLPNDPAVLTIADDVWGYCIASVAGTQN